MLILALLWLLFELSIFRDASFVTPWTYTLVMIGIGLLYFIYMLIAQPAVLRTPPQEGEPQAASTTEAG